MALVNREPSLYSGDQLESLLTYGLFLSSCAPKLVWVILQTRTANCCCNVRVPTRINRIFEWKACKANDLERVQRYWEISFPSLVGTGCLSPCIGR